MSAEQMIEGVNLDQPIAPPAIDPIKQFEIKGETSKYDSQGILDENIKLRQAIVRAATADLKALVNDPDLAALALKAMDANDKSLIATARLKVEEEGNATDAALVSALVAETLSRNERTRKERMQQDAIPHDPNYKPQGRVFELPSASRDIRDDELVTGTVVITQEEIMSTLKIKVEDDDKEEKKEE